MNNKNVDSYVDELVSKGMDKKLNGMLDDPAALESRDSILFNKIEKKPINNVLVKSSDSSHVEQNPSIIVNNNVNYPPLYQSKLPTTPAQRETDEFITVSQRSELNRLVIYIAELSGKKDAAQAKKGLWTAVSDSCDVPKSIKCKRYHSITQSNFYKAKSYLLEQQCEVLSAKPAVGRKQEEKTECVIYAFIATVSLLVVAFALAWLGYI